MYNKTNNKHNNMQIWKAEENRGKSNNNGNMFKLLMKFDIIGRGISID